MFHIPGYLIDQLIAEDVPYCDLTSEVLGIRDVPGTMEYFTREECILAGTEIVQAVVARLDCVVADVRPSGTNLSAGESFMCVKGSADALHQVWKVGLNVFDHLSAIATKTRAMVDEVHQVNPNCEVLTTRKSMPGVKKLFVMAIMAGGAFPHRLGLSETVLVFDHHLTFYGGIDRFLADLPSIKRRCIEKKLFVEADAQNALRLASAGVDGVQLDKVPVSDLAALVCDLRKIDPRLTIIAAGGINPSNAVAYAATGVDGLALTALFSAPPLDMSVRMYAQ